MATVTLNRTVTMTAGGRSRITFTIPGGETLEGTILENGTVCLDNGLVLSADQQPITVTATFERDPTEELRETIRGKMKAHPWR